MVWYCVDANGGSWYVAGAILTGVVAALLSGTSTPPRTTRHIGDGEVGTALSAPPLLLPMWNWNTEILSGNRYQDPISIMIHEGVKSLRPVPAFRQNRVSGERYGHFFPDMPPSHCNGAYDSRYSTLRDNNSP